jgi:hypothetical protein
MESTKCYKIVQYTVRGYRSYVMRTWIPDAVMYGTEPFIARGRKEVDGYRKEVRGGFIHSYAESSLVYVIGKILSYDMLERGVELWECRIEPTPGFGRCYVSDEKFPEYASDELWFVRPVVRDMDDLKSLVKTYGIKRKGFLGRLKEGLFLYIRIVIKRLKSCV